MENKGNTSQTVSIPAARAIPIKELSGWLSKMLDVPPQRLGIVIRSDGKAETFSAGKHSLLNGFERLGGRGVGLQAGFIPAEPFSVQASAPFLLSGDENLIDTTVTFMVSIIDPQIFFTRQVIPHGELKTGQIDLSGPAVQSCLGLLVRRYAASDLIYGLPTNSLARDLLPNLSMTLQDQGLQVESIQMITFWRSDDQVKAAEKIMHLEQELQDIELQKKMAAVESQVQLDDFIRQLEPDFGETVGLRPVITEDGTAPTSQINSSPTKTVQSWLQSNSTKNGTNSHWKLADLFQQKEGIPDIQKPHHPPRYWWLGRTIWIVFLCLVGVGITYWSFNTFGNDVRKDLIYGFLTGFWLFLLPFIMGEIKKLVEKREEIHQALWNLPNATYLEKLVGRNKKLADHLVRGQCRQDLERSRGMLEIIVSRLYENGDSDSALKLRELRRRFESALESLEKADFGAPAYLGDIPINGMSWERMLDYDENLLGYSGIIAEQVYQAQQSLERLNGVPSRQIIEQRLDDFLYRFSKRSQILKIK